jgi:hypothetical protein
VRYVCFILCTRLLCTKLTAQEIGELSTERPGFTATSGAVGLGVLQLEQGYTLESARLQESRLTTVSGPQALVRFGISEVLELRFSTSGYGWRTQASDGEQSAFSGQNDYVLGAKLRLLEQAPSHPEVSITGGVSLPASGSPFTTTGHDPSFTLAAYKDLPGKFSLAANANLASITDAQGRILGAGESLWAARNMGPLSVFTEAFHTTVGRAEGSETVMDGGMFRGLGRHAQIDVAAGHTVAGGRPSWFVSVGLVLRAPRALLARGWLRSSR